ncbi:unnamed protein product [Ectocarpus sp. 12 AP-2014]
MFVRKPVLQEERRPSFDYCSSKQAFDNSYPPYCSFVHEFFRLYSDLAHSTAQFRSNEVFSQAKILNTNQENIRASASNSTQNSLQSPGARPSPYQESQVEFDLQFYEGKWSVLTLVYIFSAAGNIREWYTTASSTNDQS